MGQRGIWTNISQAELEKLAALQCTHAEIASWFGVTERTIERRLSNPKFAATLQRGKNKGKISLRRQQMRLVEEGSASMAIFLGKNYLGQTDHHQVDGNAAILIVTPALSVSASAALALGPTGSVIDIEPG